MSDVQPIRILSIDDHPLLREGIATIIQNQPDMSLVADAATTGGEGIQKLSPASSGRHANGSPAARYEGGIDALIAIRAPNFPEARIVLLTTFGGDVEIQRALEAGAFGYLLKTMPPKELVEMIRSVHMPAKARPFGSGRLYLAEHLGDEALTPREIDVLGHIAGGNRNRDIAERLFISEETVKVHIRHIMEKLGASDRTQAVAIAVRRGIVQL